MMRLAPVQINTHGHPGMVFYLFIICLLSVYY
jgi:hypothetical protein